MFGREEAGGEGVDAHAFGGPLAGEKLGEAEHRGLGGGVGHHAGEGDAGGDAGKINDAPAAPRRHARAEFLAGQQHAADKIEVEIPLPIRERDVFEFAFPGDGGFGVVAAGGVDQDGGGGELGGHRGVRGAEAFPIHGVHGEKGRATAGGLNPRDRGRAAFRVAAQHRDRRARRAERIRHRAAEGARGADDHRHFTGEIK